MVDEAVEILAKLNKIDEKKAKKQLFKGGYTVYTALDKEVYTALNKACAEKDGGVGIGAAVTDLEANLIAVYSSKIDKKSKNLATKESKPCSTLKPLSVYAPAIDDGTINWSSRYEDSPYKYVKNLEGVMKPWPGNSTEIYSEKYAYIYQAIQESLNTVAVKCLADYGVNKSIEFLEKNFGIPVQSEKTTSKSKGTEEVIGNIALGFLTNGVSAVDMAGYYQIFANGGKYEAPKAVLKICDNKGNVVYEREYSSRQVVKTSTAEIMNRMLKEVLSPDGTGKNAKCEKVEAAGKTGTGDSGEDNWFVGVTPQYSLAFWHGPSDKNHAAEIFSNSVNTIYKDKENFKKQFTYKANVKQAVYCTESGKLFKAGCSFIRMGYYKTDNMPGLCDRH